MQRRLPSLPKLDENVPSSADALLQDLDALQTNNHVEKDNPKPPPVSLVDDSSSWTPGRSGVLPFSAAFVTPQTITMIVTWYVTGALTNSTSKQCLQNFKHQKVPFISLTLCQHLCATLCGLFTLRVLGLR